MTSSTSDPAPTELAAMRRSYLDKGGELTRDHLAGDWHTQFSRWLADALAADLPEPNAMILSTAAADGRPSARTVLLKGLDRRGFVFYTSYTSRKGTELSANPYANLLFPWHPLFRQVIVAGDVERVDRAETEAYFASRPRGSKLGAWASPQSEVIASREVLDAAEREVADRFAGTDDIPAPPHWGGLRVRPETVEFWQGRTSRLHDRLRFRRTGPDDGVEDWIVERLGP